MNYILVGDIHSQFSSLEKAVNFTVDNILDYYFIFLGDAFDSRCENSDSVSVYRMIRELQNNNKATILQSNHQWKLQRYLYGNSVKIDESLQKTIDDFENSDIDKGDLLLWLESLPVSVSFRDSNEQEYRCAHAYHSSKLLVPTNYEKIYTINKVSKATFNKHIYGLLGQDNKRTFWWNESSNNSWIRCAGHYHTLQISFKNKSIVLDSSCGDENGKLTIYDVNSRDLYQF
jgi:hypothetical protein